MTSASRPNHQSSTFNAMAAAAGIALKAAKGELRTYMKGKLSSIQKSDLDAQSKEAFNALLGLKQYRDAKRISVYLSMPSGEIQTDSIVRHALSVGKDVFVPYLHPSSDYMRNRGAPKRVMDMVKLNDLRDYDGMERDAWGIPTVTKAQLEGRRILGDEDGQGDVSGLDLILMPGVAFDEDGEKVRRLGHGKGFYDYFLHRYRAAYESAEAGSGSRMMLYGLALKEQLLQPSEEAGVPVGPHDSPLDGLITGDGRIIEPNSGM
jgi:5-formyltetrahydrofolate cyclo-ligase